MYPNIFPVEPGNDGWRPGFDTPVRRLLFHCGLVPIGFDATPGGRPAVRWTVGVPVPEHVTSQELQPIKKVSFIAMRNALRRVVVVMGKRYALALLRDTANVSHLADVKPAQFGPIYYACQKALYPAPRQLR